MTSAQALALLIDDNREELLTLWRKKIRQLPSARHLDRPTLHDHIPIFMGEIILALENGTERTIADNMANASPVAHGMQRLENGFDLTEVVTEYNILRDCIHDLADKRNIGLQGEPFHILNFVMDAAIGAAVKAFSVQQALEVQRRRDEHLAFVAHDLRTPLNAIALAAQALDRFIVNRLDNEQARKMMNSLQRNARQLTMLVNRILDENSNMETESGIRIERRAFDLWPLVESLIHDLRPIAGTGSTSLINRVPEDLTVFADATLIKRVFQNLIANAINHTPYGEVTIVASRVGRVVHCEVKDNGSGIAPERLPHIFEKYESDHNSSSAIGLGLTICKAFVEAHGGVIVAESRVGEGAAFHFSLPDK
jgi:signal transduction histidine kinase